MTGDGGVGRGFSDEEFEGRLARVQAGMIAAGVDCVLLSTEPEVRYFSGFLTPFWLSPTRPWFLLVPAAGKPVAVIPSIGRALMEKSWVDEVRVWESPAPADEGVSLLAATVRELRAEVVALPMGAESHLRMPLGDWARLRAAVPAVRFVEDGGLVARLRRVKSGAEVAKIERACAVAGAAFAQVPEWAREGTPMREVFREFRRAALAAGADEVPYLVGAVGAEGYGDVIAPPDGRFLADGDVLMLDAGVVFDGYFCDFNRNFAVGRVGAAALRLDAALRAAVAAGWAAVRPGVRCCDVFAAMGEVLAAAGVGAGAGAVGRAGHGVGMQLTESPSFCAWEETALEVGMVMTLEPFAALGPGCGMVHEEVVVVEEAGARGLSPAAAALGP